MMNSIWNAAAISPETQLNSARTKGLDPAGQGAAPKLSALTGNLGANPAAMGTSPSASSPSASSPSAPGSTITSNDFLTLLVTEMQNQDPTAQTDPNEYINQLVQINSLEQLISINQNLATVLGAASTTTPPGTTPAVSALSAPSGPANAVTSATPVHGPRAGQGTPPLSGNLSLPQGKPAAGVVAHALDGHGVGHGHKVRDIPTR